MKNVFLLSLIIFSFSSFSDFLEEAEFIPVQCSPIAGKAEFGRVCLGEVHNGELEEGLLAIEVSTQLIGGGRASQIFIVNKTWLHSQSTSEKNLYIFETSLLSVPNVGINRRFLINSGSVEFSLHDKPIIFLSSPKAQYSDYESIEALDFTLSVSNLF